MNWPAVANDIGAVLHHSSSSVLATERWTEAHPASAGYIQAVGVVAAVIVDFGHWTL
jgi:hypothetical protein